MTLFAVIVAMCLGVLAGYLVKPISGPAATQTNAVSTEAGRTCPLSSCNLRSVERPEAAQTSTSKDEPAYSYDGSGTGFVP
jgi:hypothetical protein